MNSKEQMRQILDTYPRRLAAIPIALLLLILVTLPSKQEDCNFNATFPHYANLSRMGRPQRSPNASLAISIPTLHAQLAKTVTALEQWNDMTPTTPKNADKLDVLVFLADRTTIPTLTLTLTKVQWIECNLNPRQNVYPLGTYIQFLNIILVTYDAGYTATMLMEPDVYVLKPHWGDALLKILANPEQWWIRGSAWLHRRGKWNTMQEMNGNALYNLDPESFPLLWYALRHPSAWVGYDNRIYQSWNALVRKCTKLRWLSTRFVYTSFIVNLGYECKSMSLKDMQTNFPHAYIAHLSGNCNRGD